MSSALLIGLLLSADPAPAAADAPRVVLALPAGTVLSQPMVCMDDAATIATARDMRGCENERDSCLKRESDAGSFNTKWAIVGGTIGVVIGAVVASVAVLALKK